MKNKQTKKRPDRSSWRHAYQVLLKLWQHFGENQLMVGLETLQLGESWDEEPWKMATNIPINGLWTRCHVLHMKSLV